MDNKVSLDELASSNEVNDVYEVVDVKVLKELSIARCLLQLIILINFILILFQTKTLFLK